jgi:hypothetical protein
MEHMVALKGGRRKTIKRKGRKYKTTRKQSGGASVLPFFQTADDASCVVIQRKFNTKTRKKSNRCM